jgi:hypothetical protein
MHKVIRGAAVAASTAALAFGAAPAFASHGGGGGGGGGGQGGGGQGGGGGTTAPAPGAIDLSGTWTGTEPIFSGDRQAVLTLSQKNGSYTGTYVELNTAESNYTLAGLTITGQDVTMAFTRGGKPGQDRTVVLQGTLSADDLSLTGMFSTIPITLTRSIPAPAPPAP